MMQHAYKYKSLYEMRFVDAEDKWLFEGKIMRFFKTTWYVSEHGGHAH